MKDYAVVENGEIVDYVDIECLKVGACLLFAKGKWYVVNPKEVADYGRWLNKHQKVSNLQKST